jgi:hypothetical protein
MSHHDSILPESGQAQFERTERAFYRLLKYYKALDCGHFRPVESTLARHIIERGWIHPIVTCGLSEARPVLISCAVLNSMYRAYHENDFRRALATLRGRRVLLLQEDGGYLVNRDYRDWRDKAGNPLLSASDLATVETSPFEKPSLAVVGEFPEGQTSDLSAPRADATRGILDDSRGAITGACPDPADQSRALGPIPPDQSPALADPSDPSDPQNGTIVRAPADIDLQSYSSTHSLREVESFCSEVCMSLNLDNRSRNAETYIHTKKKNLWGASTQNGVESACMEPQPIANPTVQADPISSLESSPAAPSINECPPASMLMSIPGDVVPDPALWADLEYMLAKFLPCNHYEQQFSYYKNLYETSVMVGALKRCLLKKKGINNFFYILATMRTWAGPEEEQHYDRDLRPILPAAVETPGPGVPAIESTNADPYADLMANAPGMYGEWFKDHHVSMSNNPPCKGKPNGKFMDDEDFKRRMAIKARDPDRFVKLSMSYYCPSLIMEREA